MEKTNAVATLRQTNRQYTRANREDWAELGFRNITCYVHDDERMEMLAELEVRKCEALIAMAENTKTDKNRLRILSQRNMSVLPQAGDYAALIEAGSKTKASKQVEALVDIAKNYAKRYHGIEGAFENVKDEQKRLVMMARAVAYSNACSAQMRLARAVIDAAPLRDTSIFGMREVESEE